MLAAQGFAGRADARLEIVCGLIPHLGFKSLTLRHIKYQLLIQRLVLFFYPMVVQKPLLQGLFWTFSRKGILRRFHFSLCKQARKAKLLSAPVFFTPPRSKWYILEFCQIVCLGLLQPLAQSAQTYTVLQPGAITVFVNWHICATGSSNQFASAFLTNKRGQFTAQVLKSLHLFLKFRQLFRFPCQFFCTARDQFFQIGVQLLHYS